MTRSIPATDIIQPSGHKTFKVCQIIQWSQKNNKHKCHGVKTKRVPLNLLKIPQQRLSAKSTMQAMSLFNPYKLVVQEVKVKSSPKRYQRLKVLDSDSD